MRGFEIYRAASGRYGWRLRDENGETLAVGQVEFQTKAAAERAAKRVKELAADTPIRDLS